MSDYSPAKHYIYLRLIEHLDVESAISRGERHVGFSSVSPSAINDAEGHCRSVMEHHHMVAAIEREVGMGI